MEKVMATAKTMATDTKKATGMANQMIFMV